MLGRKYTILAPIALVAAFGLAACEGDTGPQGPAGLDGIDGQDGLGYVPMPSGVPLGEYDPLGNEEDQTLLATLGSESGVWEITLDGQVQLDFGNGTAPVVADTVVYDANFDELWLVVDGVETPLTTGGSYISHGCMPGVPQPCVVVSLVFGDYAGLASAEIFHGPAVETVGYAHYGVKTAAIDMPHDGTAAYSGASYAVAEYTRPDESTGGFADIGTVTIEVDFGLGADQVTWNVNNGDPAADTYNLDGTATIAGNSYDGTMSGTVIGSDGVEGDDTLDVDGTFSGNFYGPAVNDSLASETAGVFEGSDDVVGVDPETATGSIIGGFIADADDFTPAPPP